MEISSENFRTSLQQIVSAIQESVFVSIDTEFTGLNITNAPTVGPYDTAAEAFEKLQQSAKFSVIQFGLCTFHEDDNGCLTHRAFNFYTLPTHDNFMCQTESLKFLVGHGMDLNKVFRDGIVSLKKDEKDLKVAGLKEKLKAVKEKLTKPPQNQNVQANESQREVVASMKTKIQGFLDSEDEQELLLGNFNSFQRLLLHQMVQNDFDEEVYLLNQKAEGRNVTLFAYKGGLEEKIRKEETQIQDEIDAITEACGLSAVLDAIKSSGKLLVGHNMLLDVLHSIHQFVEDIPEKFKEFKKLVHTTFPRLIDTKTLATQTQLADKLESSTLEPMVKCLQENSFGLVDAAPVEGCQGYSLNGSRAHEAGYDAYLTGLCFATMVKFLDGSAENFRIKNLSQTLLDSYMNKIPYVFSGDFPGFIDMEKDEPVINRDHIFHMMVPNHWTTGDVSKLYSPFGGVKISWINNKECLVALNKKSEAKKVKKVIGNSKNFTLQTLVSYKQDARNDNKRRRGVSEKSEKHASKKQKGDKDNGSAATAAAISPFENCPWADEESSEESSKE